MQINPITQAIRDKNLTTAQVQEIAENAAALESVEADMVLMAALTELELRMNEADFCTYVERFA